MKYADMEKQLTQALNRVLNITDVMQKAGRALTEKNLDRKHQQQIGQMLLRAAVEDTLGAAQQASDYISDVLQRERTKMQQQYEKALEVANAELLLANVMDDATAMNAEFAQEVVAEDIDDHDALEFDRDMYNHEATNANNARPITEPG
jgi:hypothetical protein